MHTNIVFQITQELKRISKIAANFLSFTKVYSEIPFSKSSYHTETSQSISNANESIISNFRSIIDLQKLNHIDFKQNQTPILFSGLGARPNFFPLRKSWFLCISKHFRQKN